jgi:hypothetical protein
MTQPVQQPIQPPAQPPVYGQNTAQGGYYGQQNYGYGAQTDPYAQQPRPIMTRAEFYKVNAPKTVKNNIIAAGVIAYISAAITLIFAVVNDPYTLIDFLLVLGLGLGVHLGKSRACAVILMVYAAINTVLLLVTTGSVSGLLIIIGGICGIVGTFSFAKAWEQYKSGAV